MTYIGKTNVTFELPFKMEKGKHGLTYLTCPLIPGLLIAEETGVACLAALPLTLQLMSDAFWKDAETEGQIP